MKKNRLIRVSLGMAAGIAAVFLTMDLMARPDRQTYLDKIEASTLDLRFRRRPPRDPGGAVVIVDVDEKSIKEVGRWPWSRTTTARLIRALAADRPKVIAVDILYSEPEAAGPDREFARALKEAGNVILAMSMLVPTTAQEQRIFTLHKEPIDPPDFFYGMVKQASLARWFPVPEATDVLPPLDLFIEHANGVADVYSHPDDDGILRWEPLAVKYRGSYYPPLGVEAVREYLGVARHQLRLIVGERVELGARRVPTDESGLLLINYVAPKKGEDRAFLYVSAVDIMTGRAPAGTFTGKIALVGTSALGTYDQKVSPFSANMPGVEKHAHIISSLLREDYLHRTHKTKLVDSAFILLFGLGLGVLLPRMRAMPGALLSTGLLVGYVGFVYAVFVWGNWWIHFIYPSATLILTYSSVTAYRFMTEERQAREVRRMFSSYVTPRVMEELIRDPTKARLGGARQEMTVLFTDIRGFTTFSEAHRPEEVVEMLNEYLSVMTDVIFHWDGTLDKFIGDAIMVFWGAPTPQADHAERAVRCALHMRVRLAQLHDKWRAEGKPLLETGIGINSGEMVVGNMGAEGKKMDYTVIGDHVNLAARVESQTREYGSPIIITEYTYGLVKDLLDAAGRIQATVRALGSVKVKGKERPVVLYEVKALPLTERATDPMPQVGAAVSPGA